MFLVKVKVAQSGLTLCDPVDYLVYEILQSMEFCSPGYWRG